MKIAEENDLDDDRTWAEVVTNEVLAEMVFEGLLDYNEEKDIWVLRYSNTAVPTVIKAVAGVNASMPKHFIMEMGQASGHY